MDEILIGILFGAAVYGAMKFVANRCFDDDDPDMHWRDSQN